MNEFPMISAKCLTYGRTNLLEETIQSFLQQDYPVDKCEMIIVNDYPLQKLIFDHSQIKIFNLDTTFSTLGEKENFATEQCQGDIICQCDDDDVFLQNHFQNVAKFFVEGSGLLQWNRGIFYSEPDTFAVSGIGNAGMVYSKRIWEKFGKYNLENAGHDMSFVMGLRTKYPETFVSASPIDEQASFIYMWGGRGYHASGQGYDTPDRPNIIQRHGEHIEELRKQGKIPTGDIYLQPHWKKDYKQMLEEYVRKNKGIHS